MGELLLRLFGDAAADVRSAAVTAVASLTPFTHGAACGTGGTDGPCMLTAGSNFWRRAAVCALQLCGDKSEKVRSSALRAVGFIAEILDFGEAVQPNEAAAPCQPSHVPPGLIPPGLAPAVAAPGEVPITHAGEPMVVRIAKVLIQGVQTPPPKCQWNACRSMGQVYQNRTFIESPARESAHFLLLGTLCHQVAGAANMKVKIQAAQALLQLP